MVVKNDLESTTEKANIMARHNVIYIEAWLARDP